MTAFPRLLPLALLNLPVASFAQDTDGDGLTDAVEQSLGTDPARGDTDNDTVPDGAEVLLLRSDPLSDDRSCPAWEPRSIDAALNDPYSVRAADLDGDGDLDLIGSENGGGRVTWYANDGGGGFGPPQTVGTLSSVQWADGADLDGDGDLDVFAATDDTPGVDNFVWFSNDGSGAFGGPQVLDGGAAPASPVAADLDADGDLDLVFGSSGDSRVAWLENLGAGSFGAHAVIEAIASYGASADDLDGDGDIDVVAVTATGIRWYPNQGDGQFEPARVVDSGGLGIDPHIADLDGDGDPDLLWATGFAGELRWSANDGAGNFGPRQAVTSALYYAVATGTADVDGDGDLDVVACSYWSDSVSWYENLGGGTFGPYQALGPFREFPTDVIGADLDGDGDDDVAASAGSPETTCWSTSAGSSRTSMTTTMATVWPTPPRNASQGPAGPARTPTAAASATARSSTPSRTPWWPATTPRRL